MSERIDSHVHLWTLATDPQDWIDPETMSTINRDFTADDLRPMFTATGASRAIIVQASNSAPETRRLLALDDAGVAGVVGWVDLTTDVPTQLAGMAIVDRSRLVGVRHLVHVDPDANWLEREEVQRGIAALGGEGLGMDLVLRHWQLDQAARTARAHPDVRFVVDHLGGPPSSEEDRAAWRAGLRLVAELPNVVAKLSGVSGLVADEAGGGSLIDTAFDTFGADRLMYGSDWPLVEMTGGASNWAATVSHYLMALSPSEQDSVNAGTATSHYRLKTS